MEEILNNPGALLDERTEEEKEKDFHIEEIVASLAPVNWEEKPESEWRKFPIFDQDGSGSCVAQTLKKLAGVYTWLKTGAFTLFSASHIYQRRRNRPSGGMNGIDAMEIGRKGIALEEHAPSERMTDEEMDAVVVNDFEGKIAETFSLGNYVQLPIRDIDAVASVIQQTGKAVMVWFYFSNGLKPKEWKDVPTIEHPNLDLYNDKTTARHSVAAVDFTLYNGKKALIIEDSWGHNTAIEGRRIITEDFFKVRNWFAAYFINFKFETGVGDKPSYDGSIISLQKCLRYEGLFPTNVDFVEKLGPLTLKGVREFQVKYGLHPTGVNNVGPKTTAKLKELYP